MSQRGVKKSPEADGIPIDVTGTDLTATEVGPAIRELAATVGVSASPGFQFGRSGNVTQGTWLQVVGGVPSNQAGITVALTNPVVTNIYVASQDIDTYQIEVFEHEGNEVNLAFLDFIQITASRGGSFSVNISVTEGRQLGVRINNGSAKNLNVGLQLQGSI